MDILAINGSPRATKGHTSVLLEYFLDGAASEGAKVDVVNLGTEKIHHCTGEFHCWLKDPGVCMWDEKQGDTMKALRLKIAEAENLVLATPVYIDGMTGLMKNMFDRCMPGLLPYVELDENGEFRHPTRYIKTDKKMILLSTCGFPEIDTFGPLVSHIERIARNMDSELVGKVLRPNGFMLPFNEFLGEKLDAVFSAIRKAGAEFASSGRVSPETEEAIAIDFIPREMFVGAGKMFWDKAMEMKGFKPMKKQSLGE